MEPERIGRYRMVRLLGQGGMGSVYEAVQEPIQRRVALKLLLPQFGQNQEVLQRFFNEAHAVNLIEHPSLVQISDYGQSDNGTAYLVMEYLRGETIAARLCRFRQLGSRLPQAQIIQIAIQIVDALSAAHGKSVVHRDLKPANVMMVPDTAVQGGERVKILDFGIAKLAQGMGQGTTASAILGTPQYMSPEQCKGSGDVDGQTDVYALGVMLFEMIAGRLPYQAESAFDYMAQHVFQSPPALRELAPQTPSNVVDLVHRLLAKDKSQRPKMRELSLELVSIAAAMPSATSVVIPPESTTLRGARIADPIVPLSSLHGSAAESLSPVTPMPQRTKRMPSISASICALLAILVGCLLGTVRTLSKSTAAATSTRLQATTISVASHQLPDARSRPASAKPTSHTVETTPLHTKMTGDVARLSTEGGKDKPGPKRTSIRDTSQEPHGSVPVETLRIEVEKTAETSSKPIGRTRKQRRLQTTESQSISALRRAADYER